MEKMRVNREIDSLKKDPSISDVTITDNKLTLDFEDPDYGIIKYIIEIPENYPSKIDLPQGRKIFPRS